MRHWGGDDGDVLKHFTADVCVCFIWFGLTEAMHSEAVILV